MIMAFSQLIDIRALIPLHRLYSSPLPGSTIGPSLFFFSVSVKGLCSCRVREKRRTNPRKGQIRKTIDISSSSLKVLLILLHLSGKSLILSNHSQFSLVFSIRTASMSLVLCPNLIFQGTVSLSLSIIEEFGLASNWFLFFEFLQKDATFLLISSSMHFLCSNGSVFSDFAIWLGDFIHGSERGFKWPALAWFELKVRVFMVNLSWRCYLRLEDFDEF